MLHAFQTFYHIAAAIGLLFITVMFYLITVLAMIKAANVFKRLTDRIDWGMYPRYKLYPNNHFALFLSLKRRKERIK